MKQKEKRKINLGKTKQTVHLIYKYRILKFLERGARRDKSFEDLRPKILEECENDPVLLKYEFMMSVFNYEDSPLRNSDAICHSYELNEQSTYYRILQERGELEEAIAELSYIGMHPGKRPPKKVVSDLAAHLRNYIGNYEVMKEYNEYVIEKDMAEGLLK